MDPIATARGGCSIKTGDQLSRHCSISDSICTGTELCKDRRVVLILLVPIERPVERPDTWDSKDTRVHVRNTHSSGSIHAEDMYSYSPIT